MIKPWVLPMVFAIVFYDPVISSCPRNCSCNATAMRCNMDDLRALENINGENITSLSLSGNKIRHIPPGVFKKFVQLQFLITDVSYIMITVQSYYYLSLGHDTLFLDENGINQLTNGSFAGLKNLQTLVLENNLIYNITREAFRPLQSLRKLNLRGNKYNHLPPSILFLPALEKLLVDGPTDCKSCEINFASNCSSDQRRKSRKVPTFGNVTGLCLSINFINSPHPSCGSNKNDKSEVNFVSDTIANIIHDNVSYHNSTNTSSLFKYLLSESVALKSFILILGISTVLVNLVTVTTVFTSPPLKRSSTIFLAGHIAVCDFLIGLFLLVAAVLDLAYDYEQRRDIDFLKRYVCPVIVSLRSGALIVEPLVLFVMTLDRYKRIVNHSKPPLSRRFITIAAYFSWFPAVIAVSLGSIGITREVNYGSLCSRIDLSRQSIDSYIEKTLIATSAILFISCCIMYFRIYRVVKTQNQRMGTQTYVRVCKLIFALVLSTMVLWYVPAIAVAFFGRQNTAHANKDLEIRLLTILMAFTANSLVNPFLYVFREKQFRQQLCSLFFPRGRRTLQRRVSPHGKGNNLFPGVEIPMADTKDEQPTTHCVFSEKGEKEECTSL